jgi:predicted transcriptional regulator
MMSEETNLGSVELATELTIAWLGNPNVRATADEVPAFLRQMHATIEELSGAKATAGGDTSGAPAAQEFTPAVTVRKSLASRDHIISMIDGKPYKTLRRHLSTHGLTPEDYRARYGLKPDYPMVAPSYSEHRRAVAKQLGLGQKGRQSRAQAAPVEPKAAVPRGRRKAAPKA